MAAPFIFKLCTVPYRTGIFIRDDSIRRDYHRDNCPDGPSPYDPNVPDPALPNGVRRGDAMPAVQRDSTEPVVHKPEPAANKPVRPATSRYSDPYALARLRLRPSQDRLQRASE